MAAKQAPLALAATAYSEQTGWRKGQELIDALPYVDALTPEEKQAVDTLIEEEMRRSTKRPADYLKELPPIPAPVFAGDALLESELARIQAGEKMAGMDTKRYNLDPPPAAKRNDVTAWRAALDNAHSQLEHQYNRLLNLELLLKFGPDTWRMHNEGLAVVVRQLQERLVETRRQIEGLNRERKLQQTAAGRELSKLEEEYLSLVHKNMDIEAACRQVEREITQAQGTLAKRGGSSSEAAETAEPAAGGEGPMEGGLEGPQPIEEDAQAEAEGEQQQGAEGARAGEEGGEQAASAGGGQAASAEGEQVAQQQAAAADEGEEHPAGPMPAAEAGDAMQE